MFKLQSQYTPKGDQVKAIKQLINGFDKNYQKQTLLGVTGSGKTFTMANIIEKLQKPTLIISHNKTLASQLYTEFQSFFPENSVHYFVSYYDYYQPEAYIPQTDTYIEKDASINEEIDRLRHVTTQALINRKDVIIIASVSCIYGIGEKKNYIDLSVVFEVGQKIKRSELLLQLVRIQYKRNEENFHRGQFRVRGENIDIHLSTGEGVVRIITFGNRINQIYFYNTTKEMNAELVIGNLVNTTQTKLNKISILPAKHFVTSKEEITKAIIKIKKELKLRVQYLKKIGKNLEAHRLSQKTNYDIEMMREIGYCNGIENYSRILSDRKKGTPPSTLIDFFPKDFLMFIDESHITIPQISGMYAGDKSRKQTLIDFGFRLPSAIDNRPLNFQEFDKKINQVVYVSATPKEYEIKCSRQIVKQIIRPTGLLDPKIYIKKSKTQIPDLIKEIKKQNKIGEKTIVTTLTKRMSEDLTKHLIDQGIKAKYLHSEIKTLKRVEILQSLQNGEFDCLIGINLLREGIDLPVVSLIAILDADMSGFLRNEISIMQTVGRAARHVNGRAILYADKITPAIDYVIKETKRRRKIQKNYNKKHNITPKTIIK